MTFEDFWKAWPKHPRKGAKSKCLLVWKKTYCETCSDQIIKHVEWLKTTDQWRKDNGAFIPAPLVYLNQQRWDGAEIPEVKPIYELDPVLVKMREESAKAVPCPPELMAKFKARL